MDAVLIEPEAELVDAERSLHEALLRNDAEGAAELAVRIAALAPLSAHAQRVASAHLTARGHAKDALPYARLAAELAPDNTEYALHLGTVLNLSGEFEPAAQVLLKLAKTRPVHAETFLQLANSSQKLGFTDAAVQFALQSRREEPANENRSVAVAYFLAQTGNMDEAIDVLLKFRSEAELTAYALLSLSGLLSQAGRYEEAVIYVEAALSLEPDRADLHLQRSWLLMQTGSLKEAMVSACRAVEIDPSNRSARRHAVSVYVENGEINEALRHGGALLAGSPDDDEYISCMSYLLDTRASRDAVEIFSEIATLKRAAPRRELPPPRNFGDKLITQGRSIFALVRRDIRGRNGESKLGFFWTLMEPFIHIGALAIVFQLTMHGKPPLGNNFFFFYFTGVMPYLMVTHLVVNVGHAVRSNKHLLQLAQITPFDLMISASIVEIFTTLIVYILFTGIFSLFGIDAIPGSVPILAVAFLLSALLGMGVGMICSALFEFGPFGDSVIGILMRLLYFASGIFYVPANMPVGVRNILSYNPLLHCIDAMRMGYFAGYNPPWNDPGYAAVFAVFTLAVGMSAVAAFSRRMRSIQ